MSEHSTLKPGGSKVDRPVTSQMVISALKNLNDGGGSSMKAIAKYMSANYPIDIQKFMPYIKRYLKKSLSTGTIIHAKGTGLSGSFKLPEGTVKTDPKKNLKKIPPEPVSEQKIKKGELVKSKVKALSGNDPAKLVKIKLSILNGKIIKRRPVDIQKLRRPTSKDKKEILKRKSLKRRISESKSKSPKQMKKNESARKSAKSTSNSSIKKATKKNLKGIKSMQNKQGKTVQKSLLNS